MRVPAHLAARAPGLVVIGCLACWALAGPSHAPSDSRTPVRPQTISDRVHAAGLPHADRQDLERWHQGPARYLLNGPETRLYRGLATASERRAFIQQFWLRRDPDLASLENEFRFEFWQRVLTANQLYTRTSEPGWKTDRGKFHILLGPPDEVERVVMPGMRTGTVVGTLTQDGETAVQTFGVQDPSESFLGLERWHYRRPPGKTLRPNFVLAFRLRESGDYILSSDVRDFSLFYGMLSETVQPVTLPESSAVGDTADVDPEILTLYNEVSLALDLGTAQRIPAPDELLGELVTSEEFFGVIPFLLQVDYYKTTGAATLAVFTVGIGAGALGEGDPARNNVLAVGKLESLADPDYRILMAGDESLVPAPDNELVPSRPLFQMVKALPPGEYNATFGILDRAESTIGSYRERIRVPAFPDSGLALSTLSLARRLVHLDDLPTLEPETAAAPFRIGRYQVVPKTEPRFSNGEEFTLYYQIYGARRDPSSDQLRLNLSYRFFILEDSGFVPIGQPIHFDGRTEAVQGWSFPIRDWPLATFRLEVTVEDLVSGHIAVGQTVFGIQEQTPHDS